MKYKWHYKITFNSRSVDIDQTQKTVRKTNAAKQAKIKLFRLQNCSSIYVDSRWDGTDDV